MTFNWSLSSSTAIALGAILGSTQTTVSPPGQADIIIALGSGFLTSHQFYLPQTFQAKVGLTVTWKNLDYVPRTVTGNTGLFASGNLDAGGVYSYAFKRVELFVTLATTMRGWPGALW